MSKWAEIDNSYFDEGEKCYTIDAWKTHDLNEVGKVIAKVYQDGTKGTVYIDKNAETDEYAQKMIEERICEFEGERNDFDD